MEVEQREPTEEATNDEAVSKTREIFIDIDPEDYEEGFKKWPEMTATSPSGRHLGLYKALLKNEDLSGFFSGMCELPVRYGFAPNRWAHALKLMLEKDQTF